MDNISIIQSRFVPVDAPILQDEIAQFTQTRNLFVTNGYTGKKIDRTDSTGQTKKELVYGRYTYNDMVMSNDLLRFIPKVITTILQGSMEPRMVISSNLFKTINIGAKIQVNVGRFGPMNAEEIGENGEWKLQKIHFDGGEMVSILNYKKIGVMFGFSEESKWVGSLELLGLMVKEAGKALARKKESLCMDALEVTGQDVFNNISPTDSFYGATSGRNVTGAFNGTFSLNDMIYMTSYLTMRGHEPNTTLMHPLTWMVFATSPDTREIVTNGNAVMSAPTPMGDGGDTYTNTFGEFGLDTQSPTGSDTPDSVFGKIGYNPFLQTLNPLNATWHYRSNFMPAGMNILVSPFVKYKIDGNIAADLPTCSIVMADSNATGAVMQVETPAMRQFEDWKTDATLVKLGEVYGVEMFYQGKSVALAKGVVVDRNYVFENVNQVTFSEAHPGTSALATG